MKRVLAFGALLLALAQAGCGTVKNFQRESFTDATPYGGVEIAAERFKPGPKNCGAPTALAWPVYAADVAASAVGDTLTLPVTVSLTAWHVGNVLWYLAFEGDENPPPGNEWRRFWYGDAPQPERRVPGGIY